MNTDKDIVARLRELETKQTNLEKRVRKFEERSEQKAPMRVTVLQFVFVLLPFIGLLVGFLLYFTFR